MTKQERKDFEILSEACFGHPKTYIKILKHGYRYVEARKNVKGVVEQLLKVQSFTPDQLKLTMIEAIRKKQEQENGTSSPESKSAAEPISNDAAPSPDAPDRSSTAPEQQSSGEDG